MSLEPSGIAVRSPFVSVLVGQASSEPLARTIRAASVLLVTALTAAAAQVSFPIPLTPVPFTLQPMVVLLGAAALGGRLGSCSQILYLAVGVAGMPVFANSPVLPQGAARLLGPTGGYLMSYPIAAFVVGTLAERGFDRRYVRSIAAMLVGLAIIYALGVLWLAFFAHVPQVLGLRSALVAGAAPFLAADVLKVLLAAALLPGLWRLVGPR
jgi:biotin transport system substrate-specific component